MPHRDQAEAMRARIEALEQRLKDSRRETAEVRAELEAELAEARAEQRGSDPGPPARARGRSRKPRRARWALALFVAGFVALVAGWFVLVSVAFPSERIGDLRIVSGSEGEAALFVSETVSHATEDDSIDTSRLAVYDLATGERRSRRVVQWTGRGGVVVLGPAPDGVWAYEYGTGLVLLDASDGSILRTPEALLSDAQREALLRSGDLDHRLGYLAAEQAVVVTLRDGTRLVVDGAEPRPFAGDLPPIPSRPHPSSATVSALEDGRVLRLEPREGEDRRARRLQPSGPVLLNASFVEATNERQPMVVDGPPSALVRHTESLEEDSGESLSRVRLDSGEPLWTTPLGSTAHVRLAHRTADAVVLVTVDGELMAFGLGHGEQRYRLDL